MLLTLRLLLGRGRLVRTRRGLGPDLTEMGRKSIGRRDGVGRVVDDGPGGAAGDGVPADVRLGGGVHALGDVEQQRRAVGGDPPHRLRLEAERGVEVGRAGPPVAAGAGQGQVVRVRERQAPRPAPVEGPAVGALVAHGEGPGAGGLADEVHQLARVVGGEVGDVGVVGGFGVGRVVDGRLTRVGVHGTVCPRGPTGWEPGVYPEIGQGGEAVGGSDPGVFGVGFRELVQVVDTAVCAVFGAR